MAFSKVHKLCSTSAPFYALYPENNTSCSFLMNKQNMELNGYLNDSHKNHSKCESVEIESIRRGKRNNKYFNTEKCSSNRYSISKPHLKTDCNKSKRNSIENSVPMDSPILRSIRNNTREIHENGSSPVGQKIHLDEHFNQNSEPSVKNIFAASENIPTSTPRKIGKVEDNLKTPHSRSSPRFQYSPLENNSNTIEESLVKNSTVHDDWNFIQDSSKKMNDKIGKKLNASSSMNKIQVSSNNAMKNLLPTVIITKNIEYLHQTNSVNLNKQNGRKKVGKRKKTSYPIRKSKRTVKRLKPKKRDILNDKIKKNNIKNKANNKKKISENLSIPEKIRKRRSSDDLPLGFLMDNKTSLDKRDNFKNGSIDTEFDARLSENKMKGVQNLNADTKDESQFKEIVNNQKNNEVFDEFKTKQESWDKNKTEILEYGHETHRRSFRILLEHVKKLSIMEAEEMEKEKLMRFQRCKSVPPQNISIKNYTEAIKSSSCDINLKYTRETKGQREKLEQIKKRLNYSSDFEEIRQPIRRTRSKSMCVNKIEGIEKIFVRKEKSNDLEIEMIFDSRKSSVKETKTRNSDRLSKIIQENIEPNQEIIAKELKKESRSTMKNNEKFDFGLELLNISNKIEEIAENIERNKPNCNVTQSKRYLLKGIAKEKVCQICEKPGDVIKCKGTCNGDFHSKCVEKMFEANKQNGHVEIVTVVSRTKSSTIPKLRLSPNNQKMSLVEQIDKKMEQMMSHVVETIDSSGDEENNEITPIFKHVTADDVSVINLNADSYKCPYCVSQTLPPCFVCDRSNEQRQKCSMQRCGRSYHLKCLKKWPQTRWSFTLHKIKKNEAFDSFVCPRHFCHTCISDNLDANNGTCPSYKMTKCLKCPATYHNNYRCVPAGTKILTSSQIICARHFENKCSNAVWCFVCSEGGALICCETCPTSVHAECLPVNLSDDNTYLCEDCECGRFPLYDELVWVKCGSFRWWPALILFPDEVPENIRRKSHRDGEFVVRFYGTYDYFWTGRGRTFLYQEGDTGHLHSTKGRINEAFSRALEEIAEVYRSKKKVSECARETETINEKLKPPPFVRIKVNRPVGKVKIFEGNLSSTTSCDCDPRDANPCGPNSNCLNRLLMTECNVETCPAGEKCKNQAFEKREYPQVLPYKTASRGWGLKTLEPLENGQFIIEYVGEVIDYDEYQRRIDRMHQQKDENYYFLTIDKDRMLDAGPRGNWARFMNHSCRPNCETQKWTVNGDTRVGLFAIDDIAPDTELTFNYNLECVGTQKKICKCGAINCSGYIGVKPEEQSNKTFKMKGNGNCCFICPGNRGELLKCSIKNCRKSYHSKCAEQFDGNQTKKGGKPVCPSHKCKLCSKRSRKSCVQCTTSYCSVHIKGKLKDDPVFGCLCPVHDNDFNGVATNFKSKKNPTKSIRRIENSSAYKRNRKSSLTDEFPSGKRRKIE